MPICSLFVLLYFVIYRLHVSAAVLLSSENAFIQEYDKVTWCTVTVAEHRKCIDLQNAVSFAYLQRTTDLPPLLACLLQPAGKYGCMIAIENGEADVMAVEAGDMFTAGRWHGLVPIAVEEYGGVSIKNSVVVTRRSAAINSLQGLEGKQLCSPGAGTMAGFILPVSRLLGRNSDSLPGDDVLGTLGLKTVDCNNVVKTISSFFGPSCVPGILDFRHNQRSDNPDQLCQKCGLQNDTTSTSWCTSSDVYSGTDGVLNCMVSGVGEVGFMSADVALKLPPQTAASFEFLCPDGKTAPLAPLSVCSWGSYPADAFITDSSKTATEKIFLQRFLFNLTRTASRLFSDRFPTTGEKRYNGSDLMWSDGMTSLRLLSNREQTHRHLLGKELFEFAQGDTVCPVTAMRLCVIGREELDKCLAFQTALSSRNLKPPLICVSGLHHWDCMQRISAGYADVLVADASDSYLAETLYGLLPIMTEVYEHNEPFLYAVAVTKRKDRTTTLLDLRGRRTCHGSIYSATGWSVPVSFLITQNRVRDASDCRDLTYQVAQIFQKACAPGALTAAQTRSVLYTENLCDLCMGDQDAYCARNPGEPYYGSTGAFRCLVEGGGHVAFVGHRTAWENTDGRNSRLWARALVGQDYELLCVDGTRVPIHEFRRCNLGRVPGNVVMTSRGKTEEEIAAYMGLLGYAQEVFGGMTRTLDFGMFQSEGQLNQDLIFRDATTRLVGIPQENRSAVEFLGEDFIRVIRRAQCSDARRTGSSRLVVDVLVALTILVALC